MNNGKQIRRLKTEPKKVITKGWSSNAVDLTITLFVAARSVNTSIHNIPKKLLFLTSPKISFFPSEIKILFNPALNELNLIKIKENSAS